MKIKNVSKFQSLLIIMFLLFGCEKNVIDDYEIDQLTSNNETVEDIDGNIYQTIKIGNQVWMAENLKSTKFRNGDPISTTPIETCVAYEEQPIYYWYYPTDFDLYECTFYTWYAINDERGLAPKGWHIPTKDEWAVMFSEIKNNPDAYEHVANGYRCHFGKYIKDSHDITYWWSSSSYNDDDAYARVISVDNSEMSLASAGKGYGFPIICVKDKIE